MFNCVFIGMSAYRLLILSRYNSDSNSNFNSQGTEGNSIRRGFIPVIRKMLLFPLVTFLIWIIPLIKVITDSDDTKKIDHGNPFIETITSATMNLQGLTNMFILMLTNSLVRNEISHCCCTLCSGGGNRRRGDDDDNDDERDSTSFTGDSYYEEHWDDEDSFNRNNTIGEYGHQPFLLPHNRDAEDERGDRRTEPAYSEDVSIMTMGRGNGNGGNNGGGSINSQNSINSDIVVSRNQNGIGRNDVVTPVDGRLPTI